MKSGRRNRSRRRPRRSRWRGRLRITLACAILAVGVGAGTALASRNGALPSLPWVADALRGPRFQLRSVELIGLRRVSAPELLARVPIRAGIPLIDVDVAAIAASVEEHPRVAHCRALRIPPNRLLIQIEEREPVALLGEDEAIDLEGKRFRLAEGDAERLPRLRGAVETALPLLRAARERGLKLRRLEAKGAGDVRFLPAESDVWVRVGAEPGPSLDDWLRLSRTGLVRRYGAREVDLRFRDSAVLRAFSNRGGKDGQTR